MTTDASAQTAAPRIALPSPYVAGYGRAIRGEELDYHSPHPDARRSLLVRSEDRTRGIEWETAPVPERLDDEEATFVLLVGIDANEDRRRFDLSIDGRSVLQFTNPAVAEVGTTEWSGSDGVTARLRIVLVDRYDDAMGYLFLRVPRKLLRPGRPLRMAVEGESAGTRTWFMVFMAPATPGISLRGNPAIVRTVDGPKQTVRIDVSYLGAISNLRMIAPRITAEARIGFGHTRLELEVPAADTTTVVPVSFELDGQRYDTELRVEPVAPLDLYLLHHTHLDIGYTHVQEEVEALQWDHLETALRLGAESESRSEAARFVWHPEGLWAVESYLEAHPGRESAALLSGIRRGWIHIDGLYTNLLTGLATGEGLVRSVQPAHELAQVADVPLRSAMYSDIPGLSWGIVPVLAQAGVRYLSIGPNRGHRIGDFLEEWGDRPFWWESPSGEERVLTWVHAEGYSLFHTGLGYEHLERRLDSELVYAAVDSLHSRGWPLDMAALRYNIGSDNGPPDERLSATVEAWNERHITPRLHVVGATALFEELERRAGEDLPTVRGDLTGYWEDGAGSSARETAIVRRAAESLTQTEALSVMTGASLYGREISDAWRQVQLYYEHTWGSWNSIAEPEAEFTVRQWERKRAYAHEALDRARSLRAHALRTLAADAAGGGERTVAVLNPTQWARSEVVTLPGPDAVGLESMQAVDGSPVATQRLSDGGLAFEAGRVPAWGERRFVARPGPGSAAAAGRTETVLDNGLVRVEIDPDRGTIASLALDGGPELIPPGEGLNEYVYIPGRDPDAAVHGSGASVRVTDRGPLVWTAEITVKAPGTESGLRTTVRLFAGNEVVEIVNQFDKTLTYDPEAVLFRFPVLAGSGATTTVGGPWGAWEAERDQPAGANRNYATMERWAAVHGSSAGLTVVSVDVPGIQLGSLGTDAIVEGWRTLTDPSPVLYSYVMNNYWETNYRAGQDGSHEFRYVLRPHAAFDVAETERFASTRAWPLIVTGVASDAPGLRPMPEIEAESSVVTLLRDPGDGSGLVLRLFNPSDAEDAVQVRGPEGVTATVVPASLWGEPEGEALAGPLVVPPRGMSTVRVQY